MIAVVFIFAGAILAAPFFDAWIEPWRPCKCANRKCARCRWVGKRPKLLARVVRRAHLRDEGWLK